MNSGVKKRIAVFASGNGSNFEALAQACRDGRIDAVIALCVCDKPGAFVIERANKFGIPVLEFHPKDFSSKTEYESMLVKALQKEDVSLICLAGYMRIVGKNLLDTYRNKIINLHPSLLPAFPGVDAIGQALKYGVKVFGCTIHYVDETLDGGKIIAQKAIPYSGDNREEIEPKIHELEHELYISTVAGMVKENKIVI